MQREITRELVRRLLPGRMAESNKGSYGSVLAAAGSMAYRGAAALCTEGALRGGAGLVYLASGLDTAWDGVTSVTNHGYTESYASGLDKQVYLGRQQQRIVTEVLSAPVTRWMLYQGGAYRPPRRR